MSKWTYVGRHADELATGRPIAPGERVELSAQDQKQDHNRRLIDERKLLEVPAKSTRADDGGKA